MKRLAFFVALVTLFGCASEEKDYLSSLRLRQEELTPESVMDLSPYNILQPVRLAKAGGCFAITDNSGAKHLTVIEEGSGKPLDLIPKGRGPGEMIGAMMAPYLDGVTLYDPSASKTLVYIDLQKSMLEGKARMDTLGRFMDGFSFPAKIVCCRRGLIATVAGRKDIWYASLDRDGSVISSVEPPRYKEMDEMDESTYFSFLVSSHSTASPDGDKVCSVTPRAAALSFASLDTDGRLSEYRRYELEPPVIVRGDGRGAFSKKGKSGFNPPVSDRDNVYLLYSGKPFDNADSPNYECNHLIIYGWDGVPKRHIVLSESVMSIAVDGSVLYGMSSWPDSRILVYDLS